MASSGSIWVSLGLKTANFQKGINRAKGQLTGFQKGMAGLKGMFNPFTIGLAAVAAVGAALTDAIRIVTDFEKANSKLQAITRASASEMESMSNQAKALGASTAFTASQVTELQTEFAKLGFPTNQILDMTAATLDGAAALGSELGEQAALTGAILKQYSLDAREASRVNDVMAEAAASSALDFEKLATAMPIVGATASAAGVSFERTTALLGTLSDRGLDASSSGTALRNVFLELAKTGLTYDEAMAKINTSTNKNAVALELFGKRGATAGVILAESGVSLGEFEAKLNDANGAAKLMAQTMLDNVAGDTTKAKSAWEGFVLSLEDGTGVISEVVRGLTQMTTTYTQMLTALNNDDIDGMSNAWAKHIGVIDDTAKTIETANGKMVLSQEEFVKAGQNSQAALDELVKRFNNGQISAARFQKGVEMLAGGFKQLTAEERAANEEAKKDTALNEKLLAETESLAAASAKAKEYAKVRANAFKKLLKDVEKAEAKFEEIEDMDFSGFEIDTTAAEDLANELSDLDFEINVIPELDADPAMEQLKAKNEVMAEMGRGMGGIISGGIQDGVIAGFSTMGAALGTALAGGDVASIGQAFLSQIASVIEGIGQQMIALGTAALLAKQSLKTLFANPGVAIAAGIGLVAVGAAMNSLLSDQATGFANGGLVTGATMGLVGEGRGTTMSNPEVIAPLDKLKQFIDPNGGGGGEVTFRIEGNSLVGILNRENKNKKFSS
jgi:hypothetical protein